MDCASISVHCRRRDTTHTRQRDPLCQPNPKRRVPFAGRPFLSGLPAPSFSALPSLFPSIPLRSSPALPRCCQQLFAVFCIVAPGSHLQLFLLLSLSWTFFAPSSFLSLPRAGPFTLGNLPISTMAGRPSNRSSQTQAMPPAPPRQNEYFVPRDGIDREVITSDICRYLGNDALVRPGTYEVCCPTSACPQARIAHGPLPAVAGRCCHPRLLHHGLPEPDIGEYSPCTVRR